MLRPIPVLRSCCMCGLNQSCAWEACPCLQRKQWRVRAWSSGSSLAPAWEPSLQCCSFPWPATSGRRTNGIFSFLFCNLFSFVFFCLQVPSNILPLVPPLNLPQHCCTNVSALVLWVSPISFLTFFSLLLHYYRIPSLLPPRLHHITVFMWTLFFFL